MTDKIGGETGFCLFVFLFFDVASFFVCLVLIEYVVCSVLIEHVQCFQPQVGCSQRERNVFIIIIIIIFVG